MLKLLNLLLFLNFWADTIYVKIEFYTNRLDSVRIAVFFFSTDEQVQSNCVCCTYKYSVLRNTRMSLYVCANVEVLLPRYPMGSCRARSVYLTTLLLGRLCPQSG